MNISFEKEAYKNGNNLNYLKNRKHYAQWRQKTLSRSTSYEERLSIPKHECKTKSPYQQIGTATKLDNNDLDVIGSRFGKKIGRGSEQVVFEDLNNPNQVLKVYYARLFNSIDDIKKWHPNWFKRNKVPMQLPVKFEGYVTHKNGVYPVYSQQRVNPIGNMGLLVKNST